MPVIISVSANEAKSDERLPDTDGDGIIISSGKYPALGKKGTVWFYKHHLSVAGAHIYWREGYTGESPPPPPPPPPPPAPTDPDLAVRKTATDVFLRNRHLSLAFNDSGTIGAYSASPFPIDSLHGIKRGGFVFDPDGFASGQGNLHDVVLGGTPVELFNVGYVIGAQRVALTNARPLGRVQIPGGVLSTSEGANAVAGWSARTAEGLVISQTILLGPGDEYFETAILMTNFGTETLKDVRYMRSMDPDHDPVTFVTENRIVAKGRVEAKARSNGYRVYYDAGEDERASVAIFGFRNYDPFAVPEQPVGFGVTADQPINMLFRLGDLAPGRSATFSFATGLI